MLVLVEPFNMNDLSDRPHLGCATLIAACQKKGIKTTLIKGQTRYLKDMFINDSEELWSLIQDLKESDIQNIGIVEYKKSFQEKGISQFQYELKDSYQKVMIDKNPRHYFISQTIERFYKLYATFMRIYFYYFRKLGHYNLKIIDRYISEILKSNPRYIGFSLQGKFGSLSRFIRKRIKELTNIPIIVGGSLTPFIDFKKIDKIFEEEYFDYLVIGAGDHAFPSLIGALDNKKEPKGIANVFYKKGGKIKGYDLKVVDDLDSLPYPDYSQFDLDLYLSPKRILPLQTARGCSWKRCAFCSFHKINLGKYRVFSIDKIIGTLRYLNNTFRCQFFSFNQEELSPEQARGISEAILSNNLDNIYIHSTVRLENGYNNTALLRLMRKAGFVQLHWGMESGNQRVLNLMNKGTNIKTVSQILKKSFKSGIGNICFAFFGFPGETEQEAQQTIEFLKKNAKYIDDISVGNFVLEPYSPIWKNPERWGVEIEGDGSYSTKSGMSYEKVKTFLSKFYAKIKLNSVEISSDKSRYLLPEYTGHSGIMTHFLMSSHNILSNKSIMKYLEKKKFNDLFPIILGGVKNIDQETVLFPINIKESSFINKYFPEKERILDKLEQKIFILSDGTLSIEDIMLIIYNNFKVHYGKEYIYRKCIDFFHQIFSKNLGIAFAKSWHSSYNRV